MCILPTNWADNDCSLVKGKKQGTRTRFATKLVNVQFLWRDRVGIERIAGFLTQNFPLFNNVN
ncbi:MAG: hypothetical protein BVN35_05515 [Proteobacteria bacterium ST_bin11]|nr:MAG: hypothetical protein BVN35_05515 [Proteobacteria bacterium ST_bin11]